MQVGHISYCLSLLSHGIPVLPVWQIAACALDALRERQSATLKIVLVSLGIIGKRHLSHLALETPPGRHQYEPCLGMFA